MGKNGRAGRRGSCGALAATLCIATWSSAIAWDTPQWVRQLGTADGNETSISTSVATDDRGSVYISGFTEGSLAAPSRGGYDAWVAKYSASGVLRWKRQLGTSDADLSHGVATDGKGNVYISGQTGGSLAGPTRGGFDAFVAKYSAAGVLRWKRQLGTSDLDRSNGVATDGNGNVYIAGYSLEWGDALVAKYSAAGKLLWKRELGKLSEFERNQSNGVATDGEGNVYISGYADGFDGGPDAFVAKYATDGTLMWRTQLGTPDWDYSNSVATDADGYIYISGFTNGACWIK